MASSWRWLLVVVALLVGALAFACDGGDDNGDENGDQPTEEATVEDGDDVTPEATAEDGDEDGDDDGDGGGDGGAAFEDVPLPDGADEQETLTMSGTDLPFFVPTDADVDAEAFGEITMKTYAVDSPPGDVVDFYQDNQGDWDETYSLTIDEGGLLIWTKGEDRAVWISIGEGEDADSTELVIIAGRID